MKSYLKETAKKIYYLQNDPKIISEADFYIFYSTNVQFYIGVVSFTFNNLNMCLICKY